MRGVRRLRAEAQRLRMRLRESEENRASEQASALARIAAYEKAEAERVAGEILVDAEDLWVHTDAEAQRDWNDEFGQIVNAKVRAAAEAIAQARPHLAKPQRPPSAQPVEGLRPGASPERKPAPASWSTVIRGA